MRVYRLLILIDIIAVSTAPTIEIEAEFMTLREENICVDELC